MKTVGIIGGWKVTQHALDRAIQRRVSPEDITSAINHPAWTRPGRAAGRLCCHGDTATVVIDKATKTIVTII